MTTKHNIHRTTRDAEVAYDARERRVYYFGRDGYSARGDVLDDPTDDEIERAIAEAFRDPVALQRGDHDGAGVWIDDGVRCVYCNRVNVFDPTVPLASDDAAWDKLAKSHAPGCEWVRTRAHQLDPAEARS